MRPTTSFCALVVTTAAGTSGSRTPALLPRFAASGGPLQALHTLWEGWLACPSGEGGAELSPCRAGLTLPPEHEVGRRLPSPACPSPQLTHLFDNEGTVLFAIFMALWGESLQAPGGASLSSRASPAPSALCCCPQPTQGRTITCLFLSAAATVFLEIWKRQRACVVLHWDLYGWDEDQVRWVVIQAGLCSRWLIGPTPGSAVPEAWCPCPQEEMALELINCPNYQLRPHQHSYLRSTIILILSLFMVLLGDAW